MTDTAAEPSRVTKREFISSVADRSGMTKGAVKTVYEALVEEITDTAKRDDILVLTGFGSFSRHMHKGHKVQFGRGDVGDYPVLKFSAARGVNRRLRDDADSDPEPDDVE